MSKDICRDCRLAAVGPEDPDGICPDCVRDLEAAWNKMDLRELGF